MAEAFRDGAIGFWRKATPQLLSEGSETNNTPVKVIFGLTGLNLESAEDPAWISKLSSAEAAIAARYAMKELNGLVRNDSKSNWEHPSGGTMVGFEALIEGLQAHWELLSTKLANVEDIRVIGIDLTLRPISSADHAKS